MTTSEKKLSETFKKAGTDEKLNILLKEVCWEFDAAESNVKSSGRTSGSDKMARFAFYHLAYNYARVSQTKIADFLNVSNGSITLGAKKAISLYKTKVDLRRGVDGVAEFLDLTQPD